METVQPVRTSIPAHAKAKPDARPMRMALAAGGIATFSALAAAIVSPPRQAISAPVVPQQSAQAIDPSASATDLQVVRPILYVQLSPGQTAPPGATVIDPSAPTPITVVVNVPPPAQIGGGTQAAAPTPVIIKTTQSGKVVP